MKNINIIPSDKQLRPRSGKTMVALSVGEGIVNICRRVGNARAKQAIFYSPWFCLICSGEAMCEKKPFA